MNVLAFVLLAAMVVAYVLLDGYDLGVAAVSLFVARSDRERQATMATIGPFWNGNEVWLIAAGGTLFALFPQAYAAAFSGFYFPFTLVLWLLIARGISFELRNHFESDLWRGFWDVSFAGSSALLAFLLGLAFGNIVRGVPLDAQHDFQGSMAFLLNPYALLVGLLAVISLALHGATYLMMRVDGAPAKRSGRAARMLWWAVAAAYIAATVMTMAVRPLATLHAGPALALAPAVGIAGLISVQMALQRSKPSRAFAASSLFIAGMLASGAATLYPYLLPGYPVAATGLTIFEASPSPVALATGLIVTTLGLIAVVAYTDIVRRRLTVGLAPAEGNQAAADEPRP